MIGPKKLRRHLCFLDVGHGNATVLLAGERDIVLVDVGKHSAISLFLEEQQIQHIKTVYLSHADQDHIGALVGLLGSTSLSIDRVYLNTDASKQSKVWDDLLYELNSAHWTGKLVFTASLTAGHQERLAGSVIVDILGPSPYLAARGPGSVDRTGQKIRSNSVSAVIAVSVNNQRLALLPADLDGVGLRDLLTNGLDLAAPILVYPHHGGLPRNMSPATFAGSLLPAVGADRVVFSIGRGRYGTPKPTTVGLLRKAFPSARMVCTQLSEHCAQTRPATSKPPHLTDAFAQGRASGSCCGGTIIVPLDQPASLMPDAQSHEQFIHANVATPLCMPAKAAQPGPPT